MPNSTRRPYDARLRRVRAEGERSATRLRVVEAARSLFLTRGYVATTMADIAHEAGVALQSVYTAAPSKAELLHLVADFAVVGDDQEVMLLQRPQFADISGEPTAQRQVEMIAGWIAATLERVAPVWVAYREAAAVEPGAAANLVAAHQRRHETFAGMIDMLPADRLRRPRGESTDTAWAIASIDVFLLLRSVREWDSARYCEWLTQTLVDQLLLPRQHRPPRA